MSTGRYQMHEAESLALMTSMPSGTIDGVITDPPYSSGGMVRGDRALAPSMKYVGSDVKLERPEFGGDSRDQRSWQMWCTLWLEEARRLAKLGAPILMSSDWRQLAAAIDAVQIGGWIYRGIVVWDKTEGVRPQMGRPRAQAEYFVHATNGPADESKAEEIGVLPGVYRYPVLQADKHHLTGKPTALMRDLARVVPAGGVILDPFAGSGSTGVGALQAGRQFIGIERVREYVEVARARLAAACDERVDTGAQLGLGFPESLIQALDETLAKPICPGPWCPMCSGEACIPCGLPRSGDHPRCEHATDERHREGA